MGPTQRGHQTTTVGGEVRRGRRRWHSVSSGAKPMSLDDRKAAILRAVVQEYIETAQPVGSAHVSPQRPRGFARHRAQRDGGCSSTRDICPSPTPAPDACPPTRATASSSTRSTSPARSAPVQRQQVRDVLRPGARRARADAPRHQPAARRPHRLRGGGGRHRPHEQPRCCVRCSSSGWRPRVVLGGGAVQRLGREAHARADR